MCHTNVDSKTVYYKLSKDASVVWKEEKKYNEVYTMAVSIWYNTTIVNIVYIKDVCNTMLEMMTCALYGV